MTFTYDIGFDLDNTIIDYDASFFSIGVAEEFIPSSLSPTKSAIRNYLVDNNRHDDYIFLQSLVYGLHINNARLFVNFSPLFHYLTSKYSVCIISHKTIFPNTGPQVNLHDAALHFLSSASLFTSNFSPASVFFCTTQQAKISLINNMVSNLFFDDLLPILDSVTVPQPVLFDPLRVHSSVYYKRVVSWTSVPSLFNL